MARIDDFKQARLFSKKDLQKRDPEIIASLSGAMIKKYKQGVESLSLRFLNRDLRISWPDLEFSYEGTDEEVPIQQQVLLLHYLNGACASNGAAITGEWTSFQDVPDGRFYMDAFKKRAKEPLLRIFGNSPGRMKELAQDVFGASLLDIGDFSVRVEALPLVPIALVLWQGDDEFQAEGNILFDRNISMILSSEDMAWLAGMVVYDLIGVAAKAQSA